MLTYRDIIDAFTLKISKAFSDVDIFADDTVNEFDNEGFYIQLIPLQSSASTIETNMKGVILSIKYYQDATKSKLDLYDIADKLTNEFNRTVQVNDRHLNIDNIEPNVLKDSVGYYLDFLVTIRYSDYIYMKKEQYEMMENIDVIYTL